MYDIYPFLKFPKRKKMTNLRIPKIKNNDCAKSGRKLS